MRDVSPNVQEKTASLSVAAPTDGQETALRPLRRLRQLAGEIQSAIRRDDMVVVKQAFNLLAPALSQWAELRSGIDGGNAEVARLTSETQLALAECESLMQTAMARVQSQSNQVRQQQQRLRRVRAQRIAPLRTGRVLDARR